MLFLFCCGLIAFVCIFIFHNYDRKKCSSGLSVSRWKGCDSPEARLLERLAAKARAVLDAIKHTDVGVRIRSRWDGHIHQLVRYTERPAVSTAKKSIRLCLSDADKQHPGHEDKYMFIILHEMAHLGSPSIGHTQEFWSIFASLLDAAEDVGVWKRSNHDAESVICGKQIGGIPDR